MTSSRALSRRFVRGVDGSVATIMALALLPVVGFTAAAVDYSRATRTKSALQKSADSSALIAASASGLTEEERKKAGLQAFDRHSEQVPGLRVLSRDLVRDGDVYRMVADTRLSRRIVPGGEIPIGVAAAATAGTAASRGQEFVFAFDTTRSLNMDADAVAAMRDALDTLKQNAGTKDFFVTHMPFSDRVNLGTGRNGWMDVSPVPSDWAGCFEPREEKVGTNAFALTDAKPTAKKDKLTPTAKGYAISDLGQKLYGSDTAVCPSEPITGPTADVALVTQAVGRPAANGTGRFDEAMAWAWRLLSPDWRGQWSAPDYPAKYGDRDKTIVFLTDGLTEAYRYEVKDGRGVFGFNSGSAAGFENFEAVCAAAKANGIVIHVIFKDGGNGFFEPYGKRCATSGDHFHKVSDTASLKAAFKKLGPKSDQTLVRLVQ